MDRTLLASNLAPSLFQPSSVGRRARRRAQMPPRASQSSAAPQQPDGEQCAAVEALLAAVRSRGSGAWAHPALCCRVGADAGRGLFVDRDVALGTVLTLLPRSVCLRVAAPRGDSVAEGETAHHALASQLLQPPAGGDAAAAASAGAAPAAAGLRGAYIAALPPRDSARAFPLCWPDKALEVLEACDPDSATRVHSARRAARAAHAAAAPHSSHADWLWAQAMAQSRMYPAPVDGGSEWWLIPVIDIANHAPYGGAGARRARNAVYQVAPAAHLLRLFGSRMERESVAGAAVAVAAAARAQEPAAALIALRRLKAGDEVLVSYTDGDAQPGGGLMSSHDELFLYGIDCGDATRGVALMGTLSPNELEGACGEFAAMLAEDAMSADSGAAAAGGTSAQVAARRGAAMARALPTTMRRWSRTVARRVAHLERALASAAAVPDLAAERVAVRHVRRRMLSAATAVLTVSASWGGEAEARAALRDGVRAGVADSLAPITDALGAARAAAVAHMIEEALLTPLPTSLPSPVADSRELLSGILER